MNGAACQRLRTFVRESMTFLVDSLDVCSIADAIFIGE